MAENPDPPGDGLLADRDTGGEEASLIREALQRYQQGQDYEQENRQEGLECLEFLAGGDYQWPDEVVRERTAEQRPVITENRLPQFVRQVTGDIRQNKPSIKVRPVDDKADEETADVIGGLIRHIEATSDAGSAYVTAADACAGGGIGHFRIITEYSDDDVFDQDIRIERVINAFAVTWDPNAIRATKEDAMWCFVEEDMDRETFRAKYPKANLSGFGGDDDTSGRTLSGWVQKDTVRVAEYFKKVPEERTLALLSADGSTRDITDLSPEEVAALGPIERSRKATRFKVIKYIINSMEILEGPFDWPGRYIPIIPVIGEEVFIGRKCVRKGVVHDARGPQKMLNYWRSAQTETIGIGPKAPFMLTTGQIANLEDMWAQVNTRNMPYLLYNPDDKAPPPQRQAPPLGSQAIGQEALLAADSMKAVIGIYDAGLGQRSNEQSGVAIRARQSESDTGTAVYPDALNRAIRYCGAQLVDLIPKIYDADRVIRILNPDDTTESVRINHEPNGEDQRVRAAMQGMGRGLVASGAEFDPEARVFKAGEAAISERAIFNFVTKMMGGGGPYYDITVGKYDVQVTTGPSFATKRMEAADAMMAFVQAAPDSAKFVLDLIAKNMDWPGADEMAERFRKMLPPGIAKPEEDEEPDPAVVAQQKAAQQAQQVAMAEKVSELKERDAETAKTTAETEKVQVETMGKALEIAMQSGQMEQVIATAVSQGLVQAVQQGIVVPAQPQAPMPAGGAEEQPGPPAPLPHGGATAV